MGRSSLDNTIIVEGTNRQLVLCQDFDVGSRAFTNLFNDLPTSVIYSVKTERSTIIF